MKVFGIDPGFHFTGVAMVEYHSENGIPVIERVNGTQLPNAVAVRDWIRERRAFNGGEVAVVEDYVGAGHLTKEAKLTLQVLGYLRWSVPDCGVQVLVQKPQMRLSRVREATELVRAAEEDLPWGHIKDTVAAMAHALAFMYSLYEG